MFLPIFSILIILSYIKVRPAPPQPSADNLYWDLAYNARSMRFSACYGDGIQTHWGSLRPRRSLAVWIFLRGVSKLYILLWINLYYILTPLLRQLRSWQPFRRDFGRWEYEPMVSRRID